MAAPKKRAGSSSRRGKVAGNGLKNFAMHAFDEKTSPMLAKLSEERASSHAFTLTGSKDVSRIDPETIAKRYLQGALASKSVPALTAPKPSALFRFPVPLLLTGLVENKQVEQAPRLLPTVKCQASGRGVTSSAIGFDRDGLDIEEEQDSGAGELPPDPADSGQDRGPLEVSAAERALDATESEPHSEGGWSEIRTMAASWSEVKHGGGCGKAGSCRRIW